MSARQLGGEPSHKVLTQVELDAGCSESSLIANATIGSLDGVRLALRAGVHASARLADAQGGFTALHAAAEAGHEEIVRALLEAHADPSASSTAGDTPLKHASCEGHLRIASELLAAGSACNACGYDGEDALMEAAARGHAEMVSLLLAHGAHADRRDQKGRTALSHALTSGSRDSVHALLRARASVDRAAAISAVVRGDLGLIELVVAMTPAELRAENLTRATVVRDVTRLCPPRQLLQLLWICQPRPPEALCASLSAAARAAVQNRIWSDTTRKFFPPSLRRAIAACTCLATRHLDNLFSLLPENALRLVAEHVAAVWISTDMLDPANTAFLQSLDSRLDGSSMWRLGAGQQREALQFKVFRATAQWQAASSVR
jgi:hypothetical protein